MSSEANVTIRIGSTADVSGLRQAEAELTRTQRAAGGLAESLKLGASIDIGSRIVSGLAQIPAQIEASIARGVEFNATIEGTTTAVAAVLEKFQGLGRSDALAQAADAVEELKRKAVEAPGTVRTLAEAWIASAGAASAANIPVNQQIDLMVRLSQAVSRLNLPQQQLVQETRALLTGNITLDAQLAKTLGITNEQIAAAKAQGDLYGFLVGKIGALGEASDTLEVRFSNLQDTIDQALGDATKPIFDRLREGVLELNDALKDPAVQAQLKELGIEIAGVLDSGLKLTEWAIRHADVLIAVGKAVGLLGVAYAALKIVEAVKSIGSFTVGLFRNSEAIARETAALRENTAEQARNQAARGGASGGAATAPRFSVPYSLDAYGAARAGVESPADALASARRAMVLAGEEGKKAAGGIGTLVKGMGYLRGGLGGLDAAFGGLLTSVASVAALKAGQFAIDQGASYAAGAGATGRLFRLGSDAADVANVPNLIEVQTAQLQKFYEQLKGVQTEGQRNALAEAIAKYAAELNKTIDPSGRSAMSNGVTQDTIKALSGVLDRLKGVDAIPDAVASLNAAIQGSIERGAAQDAARSAAGDVLASGTAARKSAAAEDAARQAAADGNVDPIDAQIAAKKKELEALRNQVQAAAGSGDSEAAKKAAEAVNALGEQLVALGKLREEAAKTATEKDKALTAKNEADNNDAAIKNLQEELTLQAAVAEKRKAIVAGGGGTDEQKARRRLAIEEDIARTRLAIENKIGLLQGESDQARAARLAEFETGQIDRQNQLTAAATATATAASAADSGRTYTGGAQFGAGGELIKDIHGKALYGTSALGTALEPSMIDQYQAMKDKAAAAKAAADILPPAGSKAGAAAGDPGSAGAGKDPAADTTAAINNKGDAIVKMLGSIAQAIGSVADAVLAQLTGILNRLNRIEANVKNLSRE